MARTWGRALAASACIALVVPGCSKEPAERSTNSVAPGASHRGDLNASPTGAPTTIAIGGAEGVSIVSAGTGQVLRKLSEGNDYEVQWSGDRTHVYFLREFTSFADPHPHSGILRISSSGGRPTVLAEVDGLIDSFEVSPDDRLLAYTFTPYVDGSPKDGGGLVIRDLATRAQRRDQEYGGALSWAPDPRTLAIEATVRGVFGIEVVRVGPSRLDRTRFLAPPRGSKKGTAWVAPLYRGDTLVVRQVCCFVADDPECEGCFEEDPSTPGQTLVVAPGTGQVLQRLPDLGRDSFFLDFDRSGHNPLLVGDTATEGDVQPGRLFRLDDRGRLVELGPWVTDADW